MAALSLLWPISALNTFRILSLLTAGPSTLEHPVHFHAMLSFLCYALGCALKFIMRVLDLHALESGQIWLVGDISTMSALHYPVKPFLGPCLSAEPAWMHCLRSPTGQHLV